MLHGKVQVHISRFGSFDLKESAHAGGSISTEYTLSTRKTEVAE
jgi:hypothetical protein